MSDTLIHFPVYIGDALKKFIEYPTLPERGAWISLCVALIQNDGFLPHDDTIYYKCLCFDDRDKQVLNKVINACLTKQKGFFICQEITDLINKQKTLRQKRIRAGQLGGKASKQSLSKGKASDKQVLKQKSS